MNMEKNNTENTLSLHDFLVRKKGYNHTLLLLFFYDDEVLCTKICADFTDKTIAVQNHTDNIIKTAFGNNTAPDWSAFESFLEERCIPQSRSGLRDYLDAIGAEGYEPLKIIKKTKGRMAEDQQWIKLETVQ